MKKQLPIFAGVLTLILLASLLMHWTARDFSPNLSRSIPGMDGEPSTGTAREDGKCGTVIIGEFFKRFTEGTASGTGGWPRFRGPDFDNISKELTRLSDLRNPQEVRVLWKIRLGEGHAAAAIYGDRVFVLDYIEEDNSDALRCFSLQDGREIWRRWYRVDIKRNHGRSRTIPAVTDKYVLTIGPKCHAMCVRMDSGDLLWGKDLAAEFGTAVPAWYTGQCPLIIGDEAVIAPAGTNTLVFGADCETGKILWETPNPRGWKMSHSSIVPMSFAGKDFLIYCAQGGMCGISAEAEDRGRILWETEEFAHKVVAPSPLPLSGGRILMTAGYGAGAALFQLRESDGNFSIEKIASYPPRGGICSEQQTPILYKGHIFSILPNDAGILAGQFACAAENQPEKILWTSGKTERFGYGPYLLADGKLFILNENGELSTAEAAPDGFRKLGSLKLLEGADAWGPVALSGGKMILRDSDTMICLEISTGK